MVEYLRVFHHVGFFSFSGAGRPQYAFPTSARDGFRWWQVDASYWIICVLALVSRCGWRPTGCCRGRKRDTETVSMSEVMLNLRQIEQDILATGKVDTPELERLRRELYAHGKIERREADFLVELHKRVQHRTPAFEQFFYQAFKDHILAHGRIDAEEAAWFEADALRRRQD
jgi:hypothetical protein